MTARVIHVNDMPNHPDAVYIGRRNNRRGLPESPFANPFPIGSDDRRRTEVIEAYRKWLTKRDGRPLLAKLPDLRDKPLACWCRYDGVPMREKNRCHGDILVEMLETYNDDELRAMAKGATA